MEFDICTNTELSYKTSFKGEIDLIPSKLILTFGIPQIGRDKVSGEYLFTSFEVSNGCKSCGIFTLYDWKWTTLYDIDNPYTPEEFWELNKPITFNIGGHSKQYLNEFKKWIVLKQKKRLANIESSET